MNEGRKKVKGLTLTSGIITTLFGLGMLALSVLGIVLMIQSYTATQTSGNAAQAFAFVFTAWLIIPLIILFGGLGFVVGILNLVLGIFLITSSTKSDRDYLKRKGFVITTIVFDFITMVVAIIAALAVSSGIETKAIIAAVGFVALFSAIIKITDLKLTKKRYAPIEAAAEAEEKQRAVQGVNFAALQPQSESSKLEIELKKLDEMKASGTISEEEYQTLRKNAIGKLTKQGENK